TPPTTRSAGPTPSPSTPGRGVQVNGSNARGNSILSNSIYSNTGLGIVLTGGANNNQAAPTLTAAASSGGTTTLSGTLNSTPNATFTVQFFANAAPDPSCFGEGQQFLGQLNNVTTDGAGNASFSATLST